MSSSFYLLIERYVDNARESASFSPAETGVALGPAMAILRGHAKDAFAVANAKGFGRMLLAAGIDGLRGR